jgi:hypothetical protein
MLPIYLSELQHLFRFLGTPNLNNNCYDKRSSCEHSLLKHLLIRIILALHTGNFSQGMMPTHPSEFRQRHRYREPILGSYPAQNREKPKLKVQLKIYKFLLIGYHWLAPSENINASTTSDFSK